MHNLRFRNTCRCYECMSSDLHHWSEMKVMNYFLSTSGITNVVRVKGQSLISSNTKITRKEAQFEVAHVANNLNKTSESSEYPMAATKRRPVK